MDSEDVQAFKADNKDEYHEDVRKYDNGAADAAKKAF